VIPFGDTDPEDAWDDGDPFEDKVAILERLVGVLRVRRTDERHDARRADALRLVDKLGREGRDARRIAELRVALETA
jgi:hypothetical protein